MIAVFKVAILFAAVAVGLSLRCYNCVGCNERIGEALACPDGFDTCFTKEVTGFITKGCTEESSCQDSKCCKTDLCNGSVGMQMSVALALITAIVNIYFLQ